MMLGICRLCASPLTRTFVDLGVSPLSNSYISPENLINMEPFFPLRVMVCEQCLLVQVEEFQSPEQIFRDYAYFSSFSKSWLEHCRNYIDHLTRRFPFGPESLVVEIASNDGYLLKYFQARRIPVLGIEPAANVAKVAIEAGIPTLVEFFGVPLAHRLAEKRKADLIVGNNVLAHVPDLSDFVAGMKILLSPDGLITMEFPHVLTLIDENQFDTIYHEHFSYFTLFTVSRIFSNQGLNIFDVEEIPTHGGSLRIYAGHAEKYNNQISDRIKALAAKEKKAGLTELVTYTSFQEQVNKTKHQFLDFLIQAKRQGKRLAGYGAPAKGNTMLNFCGIGRDFLDFTVDLNPYKQGLYLPGSRIPIFHPDKIREEKPDYILILPWNLRAEIVEQLNYIRDWGGQFVVAIPKVEVF